MLQLSFLDEVESVEVKQKNQSGSQLSLLSATDLIPIVNKPTRPIEPIPIKPVTEPKKGKYKNKVCEIVREYSEDLDGMRLKLCSIKLKNGSILQDIPIDHVTFE